VKKKAEGNAQISQGFGNAINSLIPIKRNGGRNRNIILFTTNIIISLGRSTSESFSMNSCRCTLSRVMVGPWSLLVAVDPSQLRTGQ
jgi:hypothetical protein